MKDESRGPTPNTQYPTPNTQHLTPNTQHLPPFLGVVLAGGSSRRMGRDKALLMVEGAPLIHRVIAALHALFEDVLVVGRAPEWVDLPDTRCVNDSIPGRGPLGGLATALSESGGRPIFVAGCDMPFLSPAAITFVCDLLQKHDAAAPEINGILQPLHAAYSASCYPVILRRLAEGKLSLQSLLRSLAVYIVPESDLRPLDPDLRGFRGINTQEDYELCLNHADTENTEKSKRKN